MQSTYSWKQPVKDQEHLYDFSPGRVPFSSNFSALIRIQDPKNNASLFFTLARVERNPIIGLRDVAAILGICSQNKFRKGWIVAEIVAKMSGKSRKDPNKPKTTGPEALFYKGLGPLGMGSNPSSG